MRHKLFTPVRPYALLTIYLCQGLIGSANAHEGEVHTSEEVVLAPAPPACQLLTAARVFDGTNPPQQNMAVLIEGNKIKQVAALDKLTALCNNRINFGDATILPGFIESHAHITFQNVRKDKVLRHGITTVQDTGGPLLPIQGGQGSLRLLSVGPILQASGGYPLNIFGGTSGFDKIGYELKTAAEAEQAVQHLVSGGATAIKIALEPGGETGAPWMQPHGDAPVPATPWPMLSLDITKAIVNKAHALGKRVIAHVGENTGFERALDAKVDELAHMPCAEIKEALLQRAVTQGVTFVSTIDTLSSCVDTTTHKGIHSNTMSLAAKGAKLIYGSEVAHDNVPWGINGEELHMLLHLGSGASIDFTDVMNVMQSATSKAGARLGVPGLGTLAAEAPADIIAVQGNPFEKFKLLEYPDFVMSGGRIVVNEFKYQSLSIKDSDCFFNWAESKYPALFAPANAFTGFMGAYTYRFYSKTNAYLGISHEDNHVYYQGADGKMQNQGPAASWLTTAGCH